MGFKGEFISEGVLLIFFQIVFCLLEFFYLTAFNCGKGFFYVAAGIPEGVVSDDCGKSFFVETFKCFVDFVSRDGVYFLDVLDCCVFELKQDEIDTRFIVCHAYFCHFGYEFIFLQSIHVYVSVRGLNGDFMLLM